MTSALAGFECTDSGLHLETEQQKLHHLISFNQLCGNDLYVTAYKAWEELNWTYFNGSLNCPLIEVGITAYGHCAGFYSPHTNPGKIVLHQSMGVARSTLQHEMGHQWQHQIGQQLYPLILMGGKGDRPDWHHRQSWAAFCTHTDAIDGVERGRYIWKKQTSRSENGKRFKAWNYFTLDGQPADLTDGDNIGTTGFHSLKLQGLRFDGTTMSREEIDALPDDMEM